MAEFIDFIVYCTIFFNIGIRIGNVGFRLIIIVVGDKIFHRIFRKKFFEFRTKLCCQYFVMRQNQCRPIYFLDNICHSKCFSRARHPQKNLTGITAVKTFNERINCLRLIAGRLIRRHQFKRFLSLHRQFS